MEALDSAGLQWTVHDSSLRGQQLWRDRARKAPRLGDASAPVGDAIAQGGDLRLVEDARLDPGHADRARDLVDGAADQAEAVASARAVRARRTTAPS